MRASRLHAPLAPIRRTTLRHAGRQRRRFLLSARARQPWRGAPANARVLARLAEKVQALCQ
jgi:hypothetical protein